MSMPEFPKPDPELTQEQALTMILSSIALEEAALSHILNAEGEKIRHILKPPCGGAPANVEETLAVNRSVAGLLEVVLQNQMILKNKMEKVLQHLPCPPPCPPDPPVPPCPPCPPDPPVPPCPPAPPRPPCPPAACRCAEAGFGVCPGCYRSGEPLRWREGGVTGRFALAPGCPGEILMPRTGTFTVGLCLDLENPEFSCGELEMTLFCRDKGPVVHRLCLPSWSSPGAAQVIYREFTVRMPCSCSPCHAAAVVRAPCGIQVRQGGAVFFAA